MSKSFLFKRRKLLYFGGAGIIGVLGGAVATKSFDAEKNPTTNVRANKVSLLQDNDQSYLDPVNFDQQFLAQSADIKQIWDFVTIDQVQPLGFASIRNAMNAFQFTYHKTLYPIICLRSSSVIYGLDSSTWSKYHLGSLFNINTKGSINSNPLYSQQTTDLTQDSSLQGLLKRGAHLAICHDALFGLATQLTEQKESLANATYEDLATHLVPGAQQTPSGSSLIAIAQHLGFTYAKQ